MNNNISNHPADREDVLVPPHKRGLEASGNTRKGDRSKRLRVSRACDQCRAGREKCNGAQPICQTCETQSRSCTYNEQPKKRGIQPNYIRTLELTLEWVLQQFPESERALSQRLPESTDYAYRLIAFKDVSAADTLHQEWRNGIIYRQIDQLLSGSEIERPAKAGTEPQISRTRKPSSSPSNHAQPMTGASDEVLIPQPRADVPTPNEPVHGSEVVRNTESEERLRLPDNAWNLLEHYFAFTQTFLPITEKHDLLKLMYSYPAAGLHRSAISAPEHAELWSIMAWCSSQVESSATDSHKYQKIALSLIPTELPCEVNHAKALLVLSLIDMAKSSWAAAWWTIGSAIRVLTHLIAGVPFELVSTAGRTRHTLLAAFLLESTISAQTGAIPHLPPSMVQTLGLPIEDGIEEWSPWSDPTKGSNFTTHKNPTRSISTFNELVRIALRHRSSDAPHKSHFNVVINLLHNAFTSKHRDNPAQLLAQFSASEEGLRSSSHTGLTRQSTTPLPAHAQPGSLAESWHGPSDGSYLAIDQHPPFQSVPNDGSESVQGSTPAQRTVSAPTPNMWLGNDQLQAGNLFSFDDNTGHLGTGADIFEELAMLDAAEENPKFMQNLGFGPDLDLAEFFGEDYQPSDTLLMYGQPAVQPDSPELLQNSASATK